ncbi:hypothetical protein F5B18DRAFT_665323 [Nemania serpens]|nr:hypothetical protein F5B18DRAFT_665323 [Nemania serpens]
MQEFYLKNITNETEYDLDAEIILYILHNGAWFYICYVAEKLADSPSILKQHQEFNKALYEDDGEGYYPELTNYLYPASFILKATVSESHFVRPGQYMGFIQPTLSSFAAKVSVYSSRQVQVLAHTLLPHTYLFKPWSVHGYYELRSYGKILAASKESPFLLYNAYICRLHGLVIDNEDDVLQHYHLDSVEENNKGTMHDLVSWTNCANEEGDRWSNKIRGSVQSLHAVGVVWGDAKPLSVLIGKGGNAYLIDFGGSYTQVWVDEDKMEIVEGDLQSMPFERAVVEK